MSAKPFPKIALADKVWHGNLAVYDEHSEPRTITLSTALRQADADTKRYIVFHELGHWFRREHVPGRLGRKDEERFAHSFASFMLSPRAFSESEPDEHARMAALVSSGNRKKLSRFASSVLGRLRA